MNWQSFENRLQLRMKHSHIPGVAVAVSKAGKVVYQKGFGVRNVESKEPITPDTIFGIASVTKSIIALAILKLEDEGKLSTDDAVVDYLPGFRLEGVEPIESIKINHLLTHSTGLAPMKRREALNRFSEHLTYLANEKHDLLGKPGEFFSYCNDSFLLLGAIIERVTGRLFRRFVTQEVLEPLQMYRSTFSIEELEKFTNVSTPYIYQEENKQYVKQQWPALGNYEVGGGVRSTVVDLLNYGALYVNNGSPLLTSERLKKMLTPSIEVSRDAFYGYALKILPNYHGLTLIEHGGGQPGVSSNFGFIPEENLVVVVLTNVSEAPAADIWLDAVNTALNLPIEEKRRRAPQMEIPQASLRKFVGTYKSREGGSIQIELEGENLMAKLGNKQFLLHASEAETFVMTPVKLNEYAPIETEEKVIRFYFHPDGRAWACRFGMRMLLKVEA
ncbi:serine hydrolase [Caldibacillus lycopersici]|uniref:Serine hydrolase n=1 Tax=Perspicuibacillus lycopersici TaxID=1325689 RepID=A0AAE3IT69_9BACI|nr:serine hydrolase [Perspicuibacillus lycopersici]MCU9613011.1 serine hydrolase [Perspicuibacillus lycopersici]